MTHPDCGLRAGQECLAAGSDAPQVFCAKLSLYVSRRLEVASVRSNLVLADRNWLGGWTVETVNLDMEAGHDDAEQHRHDGDQVERDIEHRSDLHSYIIPPRVSRPVFGAAFEVETLNATTDRRWRAFGGRPVPTGAQGQGQSPELCDWGE